MKIIKNNNFDIGEIEEIIGLVEGYSIAELMMNEDSVEHIRKRAIQKMIDKAKEQNANIIVDFELISTHLYNGYCEVYCSGNALKIKKE